MRIGNVTFDALHPPTLCAFWAAALGYQIEHLPAELEQQIVDALGPGALEEKAAAVHPSGEGPRLWFQRVPEGKVAKNRLHLDLDAENAANEVSAKRRSIVCYIEAHG